MSGDNQEDDPIMVGPSVFPKTSPLPYNPRVFPYSAVEAGFACLASVQNIRFSGPFGPLVVINCDNRSTTVDAILRSGGLPGVRIGPGRVRRFEFEVPTLADGYTPVSYIDLKLLCSAADASGVVYVDIE